MVDPCSQVVKPKSCLSFSSFVLFGSSSVALRDLTYETIFLKNNVDWYCNKITFKLDTFMKSIPNKKLLEHLKM